MSFTKRRGHTPNLEFINIDNDDASRLRSDLKRGQFDSVEKRLRQVSDTNQRTHLLEAAADWSTTPKQLEAWKSTGSDLAALVMTIHRTKMAWNFSNWTHGANNPAKFQQEIRVCTEWFDEYASSHPEDGSVAYWRIWLARAKFDADEARSISGIARQVAPNNIANASNSLYSESGSWFGSPERVLEHAEELRASVPRAVGSDALIIEAHFLNHYGKPDYWASDSVRSDVTDAAEQSPIQHVRSIAEFRAAHWFAWGLSRIDRFDLARPYFERLEGDAPATPWGSMRFGLDALFSAFKRDRKKALRQSTQY